VAFGAREGSTTGYGLYIADISGGGARRLGDPNLQGVEPSWSPDGSQIAFKHIGPCCDTVPNLWLIGADGSNPHAISKAGGFGNALWNTVWSPDGRQLAFLAAGNGGRLDVYVVNADGTAEQNVSDSPEDEYWPSWSPDGTRIAFAQMNPDAVNRGTLVVIDPDGSRPVRFDGSPVNSNSPVWSPDGSHVLAYLKQPDPAVDDNVGLVIFDVTGTAEPTMIPAAGFGGASWQRLAP
jgi:Tol biopolymer transport system component